MVTNWFQTIISLIQLVHMYASEMPVIFAFVFPPVSLCQFIQISEAVRLHFINNSLRISLQNCRRTDILYLTDTSVVWTFDGWLFEARHWPLRMHLWIWFWRRFPFHLKKKTGHMNHMNQPELSRAYFAGISSLYMWVRLHVWAYQKFGRVSALFKTRHYLWFRIEIGVLSNWEHGDGDGDGENPRVLHIWVPIKQAINRRSLITFATAHLVRLWSPAWSWIFFVVVFFPLFFQLAAIHSSSSSSSAKCAICIFVGTASWFGCQLPEAQVVLLLCYCHPAWPGSLILMMRELRLINLFDN